jgi:RNA polymerase sigma factor (sigma-70 family)
MDKVQSDDINALLRDFREHRSERAFEQIVARYAGLVYGVAFRTVRNRQLAEEISQDVFVLFARRAPSLMEPGALAAWLHRTSWFLASRTLRSELRRQRKMEKFQQHFDSSDEDSWETIKPLLDEAVHRLGEEDRRVLMLRYFEDLTSKEIAERLDLSAEAAQKRCARATERLAQLLRGRGVAASVATLAAGLSTQLGHSAPAGLAAALAKAALASGAASGAGASSSFLTQLLQTMAATKLTTTVVVLISAAIPVGLQVTANRAPEAGVRTIAAASPSLPSESPTTANPMTSAPAGAAPSSARRIVNGLDLDMLARQLARLPASANQPGLELDLQRLMFTLDAEQVREVARLIASAKNVSSLARVSQALFSRWAELNPLEAVEAGLAMPAQVKWSSLDAALVTWVGADTDAALNWLNDRSDLGLRDVHYSIVFRQAARKDPIDAVQRASRLTDSTLRRAATLSALEVWAQTRSEDALSWAQAREDEKSRNEFAARVISSLTRISPERAINLAQLAVNPHVRQDGMLLSFLQWCRVDPPAAGQAYVSLPAQFREAHTLNQMALSVAGQSLAGARELLAVIPEGPMRNPVLEAIVMTGAQSNPAAVAEYAVPLAEDPDRRMQLRRVVSNWHEVDPVAVKRWIGELPVGRAKEMAAATLAEMTNRKP